MSDQEKLAVSKGEVTFTNTRDPNAQMYPSLVSSSIFGAEIKKGQLVKTRYSSFYKGHIELPAYCFNYGIVGKSPMRLFNNYLIGPHLWIRAGNKETKLQFQNVAECKEAIAKSEINRIIQKAKEITVTYKDSPKEFLDVLRQQESPLKIVSIAQIADKSPDDYYFGAEAILKLLEYSEYFADNKIKELANGIGLKIWKGTDATAKGNNYFHLFNDWYYFGNNNDDVTSAKRKWYEHIARPESQFTYAMNEMRYDELRKMITKVILIIPKSMRPKNKEVPNPLTRLYERVIEASQAMKMDMASTMTCQQYADRLSVLHKALVSLYIAFEPMSAEEASKVKKDSPAHKQFCSSSIIRRLSSKEGHIRGRCLAKRKDYSGRSAITVNANLRIDEVGIPKEMLKNLFMAHIMKECNITSLDEYEALTTERVLELLKEKGILERVYVCVNRAPTLHKLSYLGSRVVPTDGRSIELGPLVCPGFNADFDGDQMAVHVPISEQAVVEVRELMCASKNLFHPANGEHTIVPRHEILFGIMIATSLTENPKAKKHGAIPLADVYDLVRKHEIKIYDTVQINGRVVKAGYAAFLYCLPTALWSKNYGSVTKKNIVTVLDDVLEFGEEEFIQTIQKLTAYGFDISELYAPQVSILRTAIDKEKSDDPFREFKEKMEQIQDRYADGLEDELSYSTTFDREYDRAMDAINGSIEEKLGPDNGFLQLVNAGARGSKANLVQIYQCKGKVARQEGSFRALFESSFAEQLSPMEHFVNAYAARVGVMDRSQKTSDTGYLNRQMYQGASDLIIKTKDCGTANGLKVSKTSIRGKIAASDSEKDSEVAKAMKSMITGRYASSIERMDRYPEIKKALQKSNLFINDEIASMIVNEPAMDYIIIRSPLYCEDGCCQKCYGIHMATRKIPPLGTPIGLEAGHSIGEPATQLTMRTFQTGGIAGKGGGVTSDFKRMKMFVRDSDKINLDTYDPIAWATGETSITESEGSFKIEIKGSKHSKTVRNRPHLKAYVTKGEGMCMIEGDHDPSELLMYSTPDAAKEYLPLVMFMTYWGKVNVNFKHFEVLCSEMIRYKIITPGRLTVGQDYSWPEIVKYGQGQVSRAIILSAIDSNIKKDCDLNAILMERVQEGLQRTFLAGTNKSEGTIMSQLLMGEKLNVGTNYNKNYIKERL